MKKNTFKKGWITGLFSFGILIFLAIGSFASCQENVDESVIPEMGSIQYEGVEYPIPENAVTFITDIRIVKEGAPIWAGWFDTMDTGDPVYFGAPSPYYLPKDIKHYQEYRKLLEGDENSEYNILKFTIGNGMRNPKTGAIPIIRVELPTKEELQKEIKSLRNSRKYAESPKTKLSLTSTMTLSRARQFFNQFWNLRCENILMCPCLTFQYAPDGCQARAHYMRKLMADAGYDCKKIFAVATSSWLQANTNAGCCVQWGWHVAPLVSTTSGDRVIDPSLFNGPVTISTWLNKMKSTCAGYSEPGVEHIIKPSYIYVLPNVTDDDYSETYKKLAKYSTLSGCEWID